MSLNVNKISNKYNFDIESASYIGVPLDNTVMYITKKVEELLSNLDNVKCCLVFAENTIDIPEHLRTHNCFVLTENPQRDYTDYVSELFLIRENERKTLRYTLTESGYYIGENVIIGEGSIIEPLCFIDHGVVIGKNARIHTGTKIKNACIGDNFLVGENCTVGTYGFTMAKDENGNHIRIPTLGKVIIGSNVELGALSNISCGSAGNTVIGNYVKVDSLVHIGHDAQIHDNVEISAGVIVGGFDELGENAYIGINATLRNRIKIGENAVVGMGAVVTKSVDPNITVVGNPAKLFEKR